MTKPRLYIMCGLAFSGKSTLARKLAEYTGSKLIAFDKLWVDKDKEKLVPKNSEGWRYIRDMVQEQILVSLKEGTSVVYDDNNPRREHREEINRTSQERHDVEPETFEKVMQDLEVPITDENVVVFTSEMNIDEFLKKLNY